MRNVGAPEEIVCEGQTFEMDPTPECLQGALDLPTCTPGVCEIP